MKLQIKDSGSWRNVLSFTRAEEAQVLRAASDLLRVLQQPNTVMRVAEGETVLFRCAAPDYLWQR